MVVGVGVCVCVGGQDSNKAGKSTAECEPIETVLALKDKERKKKRKERCGR